MILQQGPINHLAQCRYGLFLYNRHDVYIGRSMEVYGEYSQLELELLLSLIKSGDSVVEVGANIGTHTVPMAKAIGNLGRVWAFEPQPTVFQTLCANLALNSLTTVFAEPVGMAADSRIMNLPELDYRQPNNFGGIALAGDGQGHQVRCVALDDAVDARNLSLIKIDVEGMESEVLKGAQKIINKHRPVICVENDRQENASALISDLQSLDYQLFKSLPPLFNPNNFRGYGKDIFGNIVSSNLVCLPKEKAAAFNLGLTELF